MSDLLKFIQLMGANNQTKFGQQMGQAYNPAAQFMPDMTPVGLLGKKDEKDPNATPQKSPLLGMLGRFGSQSSPQRGGPNGNTYSNIEGDDLFTGNRGYEYTKAEPRKSMFGKGGGMGAGS